MSYRVVLILVLVTALASESDALFFFGLRSDCAVQPYVYGTLQYGCRYPYTNGDTCYFRCFPGFVPVSGNAPFVARTCQADATWSGETFRCHRGFGGFFFAGKK
ncbi:Hypp225 [Branchiostoma lanceolatum]|uniref:Hypp225 protein n=1 Tax=Branchiostoma lanceolatum TaxID=7740 RepID=A0A8J9V862_BRALA|nr:Hypp225 [Branchiostoma lanceolatum]